MYLELEILNIYEVFHYKYHKYTYAQHNGETVTSLPLNLQPTSISELYVFVLKYNLAWKLLHLKANVNMFKKSEECSRSKSWEDLKERSYFKGKSIFHSTFAEFCHF